MALVQGRLVGGQGGLSFSYYGGTDGRVMQKIAVWAAQSCIKAISIWLSDGVQRTFGDPSRPAGEGALSYKDFTFANGELVNELSLWGNGAGTRSGWIYFETSGGRKFDHGMTKWRKKTEYKQNVASGIWVGIRVRSGSDVDALGVVFLEPIRSCKIIKVRYPNLQFSGSSDGSTRISKTSIKSFKLLNASDKDQSTQLTWELDDRPTTVANARYNWSLFHTSDLLHYIRIPITSFRAHTPDLSVNSSNVVGWKHSDSEIEFSSRSLSPSFSLSASSFVCFSFDSSSSVSLSWARTGSLLPSGSVDLTPTTYRGDATNISFTGFAQFTTTSSNTFSYPGIRGQFTGQSYLPVVESN